jgi:hypothetical protein
MKRIILLCLLLLIAPNLAYGDIKFGDGPITCDSCTGNLIFTTHFEGTGELGTDFNITIGNPCGCNTNADKTISYYSEAVNSLTQKSDGSYSFYRAGAGDYAEISTDVSKTAGTLTFDIYLVSNIAAWDSFISILVSSGNYIYFGVNDPATRTHYEYKGNNTSKYSDYVAGFTTGVWHSIVLKWSTTGVDGKYLYIQMDGGTAKTYSSAITEIVGTPSLITIGGSSASASVYYIDNIKLWNSWQ